MNPEIIHLDTYEELHGDFRTFQDGKMHVYTEDDKIVKVGVDLNYDNYDYWGTIKHDYSIGDTVRVLNMRMKDVGGRIMSFQRLGNVLSVTLANDATYKLIDCIK